MEIFDGPSDRTLPVRLRPYQKEAVEELKNRLKAGKRRVVIVAATGSGKTSLAAYIIDGAVKKGLRVIFMAHRRELINQAYNRLLQFGLPEEQLGILMGNDKRRRPGAKVQVASVDTLRNRAKPLADIVFIDECLPAGTLIDGRPIESIRAGDRVWSYDHELGRTEKRQVTHVFRSKPHELVTVKFDDGQQLVCTPGHPIYTPDGYLPAGLLQPNDIIARSRYSHQSSILEFARVDRVEVHQPTSDGRFGGLCPDGRVYNVEVEGNHNFFANGVLTHNCHRATAKSYRDISACYPNAIHLGLTATPFRANGSGLGDAYDDLLQVSSPRQLIEQGYLVEPRVFTVPTGELPDLSSVRIKQGDYDQNALAQAVDSKKLVGNLVEHWMKYANGIRTIAFAVSVAHSKHIAEEFRNAGIAAEHLDGGTPKDERDAILKRLEVGETRVVSNVNVCAEGVDIPPAKCVILARPTRSAGLYLQQAGRILRPWNGQQAIILDHGGCVLEHGLPQDDRTYSLEGVVKKRSESSDAPVKTCPSCSAVLPLSTRKCPVCATVLIEQAEVPEISEGNLVEVRSEDLKQIELARLWQIANTRGYKPGWVYYRYLEKFGEAPPKSKYRQNRCTPSQVDNNSLRACLRKAAQSKGRLDWSCIDTALRSARSS